MSIASRKLFSEKKYLIVDDFAEMRAVLKTVLRSLGASTIEQASDGEEALLIMRKTRYDVVLCDYNLGSGKDGQQVLEEARYRSLIGVDSIFIMVTAENTREMVMGAVEYTPDSYLKKPVTKELLETRLTRLFQRKADLKSVSRALLAKDYTLALAELDQLIATRPKNLPELVKLKAEICLNSNRYDTALSIYNQALSSRELPWAYLGKGQVLYKQKKYQQALEVFQYLLTQERHLVVAYDWLAKAQLALKDFESAENTLATAVQMSPRGVKRQQQLGELALNNNNTELAETAFQRAVQLSRNSILRHPSQFAGLAKSKSANNKHDEAEKAIRDLGRAFISTPETQFYAATATATVQYNQGNIEAATQSLHAADELLHQLGESSAPTLGLELAKTYAQAGHQDKADALLQTLIANNHDDDEFVNEVLQFCSDAEGSGEMDQKIRQVRQEVIRTNNNGVRLIQQGRFDEAIRLLHQAAEEMTGNKTINLNAAKALIIKMEKNGSNPDEVQLVRRYIDRVAQMAPDDWRLNDINTRLRKLTQQLF